MSDINKIISDICMEKVAKEMMLLGWMGFAPADAGVFVKRYQELMIENGSCPHCTEALENCICENESEE